MNPFVFYATLVCLAIAGSAKCEVSIYGGYEQNDMKNDAKIVLYLMDQQPSASHQSQINGNEENESIVNKCQKNGRRDDAYEVVKKGMADFYACLDTRNVTEVIKKLNGLIETQNINEINYSFFKKVCNKVSDWQYCGEIYTESLRECLNPEEYELLTTIQVTTTLIESYLCSDDAKRLSRFFSSGGLDCLTDKQSAINECINIQTNSFSRKAGSETLDSYLANLKFTREQCNNYRTLQYCIVKELSKCYEMTTANLFNSIAELIFINTPCIRFSRNHKTRID